MDEFTADAFVNGDEPIPVVVLDHELSDEFEGDGQPERKRGRFKHMKDNLRKKTVESGSSMQDRLLEKYAIFLIYMIHC